MPAAIVERLSRAYGRVLDLMMLAASALIFVMTMVIGADVLLRNIGAGGLPWSAEISEDIIYLVTLLAAPWLLRQGQHIRVDIVLRALPRALAWGLEWVGDALGLFCCLYFVWYGAGVAAESYLDRRALDQDPDHAGMVDAGAAAGRLRAARRRVPVPHAPACPCDARAARRRRLGRLTPAAMSWQLAALLLLGGSTVLIFLGMPVALSFVAINLVGAVLFLGGEPGLAQMARNSVVSVLNFSLTPIPLFILMGEVLFHTGLALKVIDGVERLIAQVPGRLAVVAVVAGTVFSAISGSTIATTAMLGSLMLPVMLARGYHPAMATGPIMAIGAVDMLIPPSALTVLLGSLSGISISKLLIGGVVPGLILSVAFIAYIVLRAKMTPALAPSAPIERLAGWARYRLLVLYVVPLVSIFGVVVGAMSAGIATPTESAALGAIATMALALAYRALTLAALMRALRGTAAISGMILFIILGATTFSQILSFSGASEGIVSSILGQGLSTFAVVAGMMALLIFLGVFVDQVSMMLITLPVFMPLVQRLGVDPIWFGVLFLICMQLGLLLPPHGLLLMTMKGVAPREVTMAPHLPGGGALHRDEHPAAGHDPRLPAHRHLAAGAARASYCAVMPPSIVRIVPVAKRLSSEARNRMPAAISSGVPSRPRSWRASSALRESAATGLFLRISSK